jgi:hypothetical protein
MDKKNKLSFIIGTTLMVANLGFSSMLISNIASAQAPNIMDACPSLGVVFANSNLNLYLSTSTNAPNTNPVSATSFTGDVYGSVPIDIAVCPPYSTVSLQIYSGNFLTNEYVSGADLSAYIPATNLELVNLKNFTCKIANNCTNETLTADYTEGQNFTAEGTTGAITLLTFDAATDYPTGEIPSGFYSTTLDFHLTISGAPPGRYMSSLMLSLMY